MLLFIPRGHARRHSRASLALVRCGAPGRPDGGRGPAQARLPTTRKLHPCLTSAPRADAGHPPAGRSRPSREGASRLNRGGPWPRQPQTRRGAATTTPCRPPRAAQAEPAHSAPTTAMIKIDPALSAPIHVGPGPRSAEHRGWRGVTAAGGVELQQMQLQKLDAASRRRRRPASCPCSRRRSRPQHESLASLVARPPVRTSDALIHAEFPSQARPRTAWAAATPCDSLRAR